jgi:hypothetical protein
MRAPTRLAVALLAASALVPGLSPLAAQSMDEMSLARDFVRALSQPGHAELIALVDFRRRADERLARGLDPHQWSELDEEARQLAIDFAVDDWTGSARGFNRNAGLVSVEALPDPDAGLGPVPDRHILRLVLRREADGFCRDVLLFVAPDLRLIDVELGPPYPPGENPAGPAGLRPRRQLVAPTAGVRWPENFEDAAYDEGARCVDALLAAPAEGVPAAIEALHRIGRTGVASALQRLAALDKAGTLEPEAGRRLIEALVHVSGEGTAVAAPTHADVEGWLVWHSRRGWTFVPVPLEGAPGSAPTSVDASPAATPKPEPPDAAAPPPSAKPDAAAPPRPRVDLGPRTLEVRQLLFPAAADLELRYAGRKVTGREVEAELAPCMREALNDWAETAQRLGLSVQSTGRPEHLVIGRASQRLLDEVAQAMDGAAALLDPIVPLLPPRETRTVVAFVFDEEGYRSPAWAGLLEAIVERKLVFAEDIEPLRREPGGLTRRQVPFFIEPTWDLTGEGEFRLPNEAAGKFAQCLVTARVGELPPAVLWAFDAFIELRLFEGVYNLNTTGFVFSADHVDWGVRTKQFLEHRQRSKGFTLAGAAADSSAAGQPVESQMITWAVIDYLAANPPRLRALLEELAAAQEAVDPVRIQWSWRVATTPTEAALTRGLAGLDVKTLLAWLDRS